MLTVLHECHEGIYFWANGQYIFQPRQGVGRMLDLLYLLALTRLGVRHGMD